MLRDGASSVTPSSPAPSSRRCRPHDRGFYAFRDIDAPDRPTLPLPERRPSWSAAHALIVDLCTRRAGELIPHPDPRKRADGKTWRVPAYRAHGTMRALSLLEVLWYLATDGASDQQRGLQPRTGGINLIAAWAPSCGWATKDAAGREIPVGKLYDAHKATLWRARNLLAAAGLVTWTVSQDLQLQDRCTDWTLMAPDVDEAVLELGQLVASRYAARHPDLQAARPRSAKVLGERLRRHRDRCARHMTPIAYAKRIQSAPLPTGSPYGGENNTTPSFSESSHRAPAGAGIQGNTRLDAPSPPTRPPRANVAAVIGTEGAGELGSGVERVSPEHRAVHRSREHDAQADRDLRLGWVVAGHVKRLGGSSWPHVSAKTAVRVGRLTRLAHRRLAATPEQVAAALVRIQTDGRIQPLSLADAASRMRNDLRHHPAMPGATERADRRSRADARRAEELKNVETPAWVRTIGGRPLAVSDDAQTTHWLLCTILPTDLDSPSVRLAVHAAAHQAGINAEQLGPHWRTHNRGLVRLVALDGACALVPPESSDAPTRRWKLDTATTDAQRRAWSALRARLDGPSVPRGTLPNDFAAAWSAIAAAIDDLNQGRGHQPPPHADRTDSDTDPEVRRGRELIRTHGTRAAALHATHPDHGGDVEDLLAVLAVPTEL